MTLLITYAYTMKYYIEGIKYYTEDCNVHHELIKLDSLSDLGARFGNKLTFLEHINEK